MHKYTDHKYFEQKTSNWNVLGFLEDCVAETLGQKIECYIKCLEGIADNEGGERREKAKLLLDRYRSKKKPDFHEARRWEQDRKRKASDRTSFHMNNPTFIGDAQIGNYGPIKLIKNVIDSSIPQKRCLLDDKSTKKKNKISSESEPSPTNMSESRSDDMSGTDSEDAGQTSSSKNLDDEINEFLLSPNEQQPNRFAENLKRSETADERMDRPEVQDEYETDDSDEEKTSSEDNVDEWDEGEDHENKNDGGSDDVDKDTRVKVDKEAFRQSFEKIPETTKLKLSSGKVVEDLLFNYVKDNDYEDHVHSFIINCDDQGIRELFNDEEWKELTDDRLGIPDVPSNIIEEIAKYGNKSLGELRKAVMTSYLPDNVPYDSSQHYHLEWIQTSIRTIVGLYENDDSPFQRNQYEYWYTVALFGACIDVAYRDAKLGTDVKRSDVPSYASSNRKNRTKKSKRKLTGRKIDGIVYLIENLHEVGAIEGARSYAGVHDKKYLEEYFKMPKTLRDMLTDLVLAVDYDESKMNKFQVFGIIHLGLKIQFSRMWRAGGSITIFKKDLPLYEVPRKFSTDKFKIFLKFLVSIYKYKMIIKNNIQVLYTEANGNTLFDELKNVGRPQTPPPQITNYTKYFANAFVTPRKPRKKKIESKY